MLGVATGRFPLLLSGARSRLGLSRLPACPRGLLVSPCGLLVGFELTQLRLFAVLAGDLAAVIELPVAGPLQRRGKQGDGDHSADDD
jgi:hypothetical protein